MTSSIRVQGQVTIKLVSLTNVVLTLTQFVCTWCHNQNSKLPVEVAYQNSASNFRGMPTSEVSRLASLVTPSDSSFSAKSICSCSWMEVLRLDASMGRNHWRPNWQKNTKRNLDNVTFKLQSHIQEYCSDYEYRSSSDIHLWLFDIFWTHGDGTRTYARWDRIRAEYVKNFRDRYTSIKNYKQRSMVATCSGPRMSCRQTGVLVRSVTKKTHQSWIF